MVRPAYAPTDKDRASVKALAAYGVQQAEIASVMGCTEKTLRKHFREELDTSAISANAKVAESLFKKATGDGPSSVAAAIFWLKSRAGWQESKEDGAGKKAQRQASAEARVNSGGRGSPGPAPKLAVDNTRK